MTGDELYLVDSSHHLDIKQSLNTKSQRNHHRRARRGRKKAKIREYNDKLKRSSVFGETELPSVEPQVMFKSPSIPEPKTNHETAISCDNHKNPIVDGKFGQGSAKTKRVGRNKARKRQNDQLKRSSVFGETELPAVVPQPLSNPVTKFNAIRQQMNVPILHNQVRLVYLLDGYKLINC